MRIVIKTCMLLFVLGLCAAAYADKENKRSGVEVSGEHKSEQGLEHGKAYAGSKEKKKEASVEGESVEDEEKGDKEKKEKKEKKAK